MKAYILQAVTLTVSHFMSVFKWVQKRLGYVNLNTESRVIPYKHKTCPINKFDHALHVSTDHKQWN